MGKRELVGDARPPDFGKEPDARSRTPRLMSWPWSNAGKYGRSWRSVRDPRLDELIKAQSNGVDPGGYTDDQPIHAGARLFHNPYLVIGQTLLVVAVSVFAAVVLRDYFVWAVLIVVFLDGISLAVIIVTARRIPIWHRARRTARAYIAEYGGQMPSQLRVWH